VNCGLRIADCVLRPSVLALVLAVLLAPAFASKKSTSRKLSRLEQVERDEARIARDWYSGLQERIADFPTEPVKGRKIVIDPGHTNLSTGAEGPKHRITEADLNWGVASALAKLLNDAGATAILTKTYGPPKPPAERNMDADLDARADVSNREQADLFVSVHHNWTDDPAINRTEVYYKLGDDGPSRDAANYVMIHLSRNLGLDAVLLPANYRVLRVNARPALLTEASYMSNPIQESLQAVPDKQKLEAQALYLGILDYFAHGVPVFRLLTSPADIARSPHPRLEVRVSDRFGLDRSTVNASFDGQPARVDHRPADSALVITPVQSLANGAHTFRLTGRNIKGNSGLPLTTTFLTDREPVRVSLTVSPRPCPLGSVRAEVSALALDEDGQPVADTRRVSFAVNKLPAGDSALHDGIARIYLSRNDPGQILVAARCGPATASTQVTFARLTTPTVQFRVVRTGTSVPVRSQVRDDWRNDTVPTNSDGVVTLQPAAGTHTFTFSASGFRRRVVDLDLTRGSAERQEVELEPVLSGSLIGARIFLDPAGNYENPDTSHERTGFNLALAARLSALLRNCGAEVMVGRSPGDYVTRTERLERAGGFKPDYYLKLSSPERHATNGTRPVTRIGHYPGSERGAGLARALAVQLRSLPAIAPPETLEDHSYEITNAPCAATVVNLRLTDTLAGSPEDTLFQNDICRQLLLGLAVQEGAALLCPARFRVKDAQGRPVRKARVTIDDQLTYPVDPGGELSLPGLDAGTHNVRIEAPGFQPANSSLELKSGSPAPTRDLTLTASR
jgi:N-acetylmuramoyl-L-alanine amidase